MSESQRIWDLYPQVAETVKQKHLEVGLHGHHDWVHAYRVGEAGRIVTKDEWGDERQSHLAGLSGLGHNADRLLQKERNIGRREVPRQDVIDLVTLWVRDVLDKPEIELVTDAVVKHDGKNGSDDSNVLIGLQDGDRVVNLDVDLFMRSAQYYHDLPVVDYQHMLGNPKATYRSPESVLRDIDYSRDWVKPNSGVCIRTRLGMKMGLERVKLFDLFFAALEAQLQEEGIRPYPEKWIQKTA